MQKNELVFGIIGTICVFLLTGYFGVSYELRKRQANNPASNRMSATTVATQDGQLDGNVSLTASEIAKHTSPENCWFIVDNKVYNVSSYAQKHPGGSRRILEYCGKDATEAYTTKDGQGSHSSRANTELKTLYIGDLGQTISIQTITSVQNADKMPMKRGGDDYATDDE